MGRREEQQDMALLLAVLSWRHGRNVKRGMRGWERHDQWMEDWVDGGRVILGNKVINETLGENASGLVGLNDRRKERGMDDGRNGQP